MSTTTTQTRLEKAIQDAKVAYDEVIRLLDEKQAITKDLDAAKARCALAYATLNAEECIDRRVGP